MLYDLIRSAGGGLVALGILFVLIDVLFFGAGLLWALKRLRVATPALIINSEGIYDDSNAVGAGFVAWNEIESVHVGQVGLQQFLCLMPTDVEAFLQRQPVWKRRLMRSNLKLVGAPIAISTVALPMSLRELKFQVEERHSASLLARMGLPPRKYTVGR